MALSVLNDTFVLNKRLNATCSRRLKRVHLAQKHKTFKSSFSMADGTHFRFVISPKKVQELFRFVISMITMHLSVALTLGIALKGKYETMHDSFRTAPPADYITDVFYPVLPNTSSKVPLISFVHGLAGGGNVDYMAYIPLLAGIASYGFVVASPRQCNLGCLYDCKTLFGDPPCFGNFYLQQLSVFEWARNLSHSVLSIVDHSLGYGVSGHSMGGQATLFSSSGLNPANYAVKAAVMHHAYSASEQPAPTVPFLAFTGELDVIAWPSVTRKFFNEKLPGGRRVSKGLVNRRDMGHLEPLLWRNDKALALYTAAWFKLYLARVSVEDDLNWENLIYGNSTDSLCGGGDGDAFLMKECILQK